MDRIQRRKWGEIFGGKTSPYPSQWHYNMSKQTSNKKNPKCQCLPLLIFQTEFMMMLRQTLRQYVRWQWPKPIQSRNLFHTWFLLPHHPPQMINRLEICHDRRDRRSCKIFATCVKFSKKQRSFLNIFQVYTHLNVNFLHKC